MTLKQIVKKLLEKGHKVTYTLRKDGSIVIRRIDGVAYQNKQGNAEARSLMGVTLTSTQKAQLEGIRTAKGHWGHKKKTPLPKALKNQLRNVQAQFRKRGVKAGKPTTANIRWTLEHYAGKSAEERLTQASRYARGIAYPENIEHFATHLRLDGEKIGGELGKELKALARFLMRHKDDETITETQLKDAYVVVDSKFGKMTTKAEYQNAIGELKRIFNYS